MNSRIRSNVERVETSDPATLKQNSHQRTQRRRVRLGLNHPHTLVQLNCDPQKQYSIRGRQGIDSIASGGWWSKREFSLVGWEGPLSCVNIVAIATCLNTFVSDSIPVITFVCSVDVPVVQPLEPEFCFRCSCLPRSAGSDRAVYAK